MLNRKVMICVTLLVLGLKLKAQHNRPALKPRALYQEPEIFSPHTVCNESLSDQLGHAKKLFNFIKEKNKTASFIVFTHQNDHNAYLFNLPIEIVALILKDYKNYTFNNWLEEYIFSHQTKEQKQAYARLENTTYYKAQLNKKKLSTSQYKYINQVLTIALKNPKNIYDSNTNARKVDDVFRLVKLSIDSAVTNDLSIITTPSKNYNSILYHLVEFLENKNFTLQDFKSNFFIAGTSQEWEGIKIRISPKNLPIAPTLYEEDGKHFVKFSFSDIKQLLPLIATEGD